MSGDVHVQFLEGLRVKFPRSTQPYIATAEGWLYVAAVLDLYSRCIVGLSMAERMTTSLVKAALEQALTHPKPRLGLMHHSDKGCQYTSHEFQ